MKRNKNFNSDLVNVKNNKFSNFSKSHVAIFIILMDFELFTGSILGSVNVYVIYNALK